MTIFDYRKASRGILGTLQSLGGSSIARTMVIPAAELKPSIFCHLSVVAVCYQSGGSDVYQLECFSQPEQSLGVVSKIRHIFRIIYPLPVRRKNHALGDR